MPATKMFAGMARSYGCPVSIAGVASQANDPMGPG